MIIQVSDIPVEGLSIEGPETLPAPFADSAWRLEALSLFVERDGADVLVRGRFAGRIPQTCSRCLEPFVVRVEPEIDSRFVPRPGRRHEEVELAADDLDVDFYANDSLNLAALVETEATLALPMKPLCRVDCRGLCPVCGGNRNLVECRCDDRAPDPRFAALKDLGARLTG
jgi:uncharacterized protein